MTEKTVSKYEKNVSREKGIFLFLNKNDGGCYKIIL